MFDWTWIVTTWSSLLMIFVTAIGLYSVLMLCVRLAGLRSFAKMSSFDFAITVAIGSLLAAPLLNRDPPLLRGMMGAFDRNDVCGGWHWCWQWVGSMAVIGRPISCFMLKGLA